MARAAKLPHGSHESHLALREHSLPAGGEWTPRFANWTLVQVRGGTGYCLKPDSYLPLETDSVIMVAAGVAVTFRASQLAELALNFFTIAPKRLGGLLTLSEQEVFESATARDDLSFQVFSPSHPAASKIKEICSAQPQTGLHFRLRLLESFVSLFVTELALPAATKKNVDATERLRSFLKETPSSELLEMSFSELAHHAHCTSRHLSRIFRELVGSSFRDMRAELRLTRAKELLATGDSKIVDVALESGYKSLSLFNLMFSRRFGTSPGKWRQKHGKQRDKEKKLSVVLQ